ncbi:MAG: radical SAM protein [Candidatus Aureabacteria bacterium]|nr:radical SAM protein [Candidatus Auribacterota bacterium]
METISLKKQMRVTLIQPPLIDVAGKKIAYGIEAEVPLGIASLAAVGEKEGYQCEVIDSIVAGYGNIYQYGKYQVFGLRFGEIARRVLEFNSNVVAISCIFFNQLESALKTAEEIWQANPDIKVIIGGIAPKPYYEEVIIKPYVDFIIKAEGETAFVHLLNKLYQKEGDFHQVDGLIYKENGQIKSNPKEYYIENLDELPLPAYHLFDIEKYFKIGVPFGCKKKNRFMNFITSRGCPFDCIFCAARDIWSRKVRMHSSEYVLRGIDFLIKKYNIEEIHFSDENLTYDYDRAAAIFNGLKEMDITWGANNGIMISSLDDKLIRLMRESGCFSLSLAIESGSQRVLSEIIKKPMLLKKLFSVVKECKKCKILCRGFFVIGMPGETKKDIWDTFLLSRYLNLEQNEIQIALPYPGTRLYDICREKNYFSKDFNLECLNNDGGPITTEAFTPDFLYMAKDIDRFMFYFRNGKKRKLGLIRDLFRKYKLKIICVIYCMLKFELKLLYIRIARGERYFC